MRVLVLKSSFVLVEWIKLLAELTVSGKVVSEAEAATEIKKFLSSTLAECLVEEDGIPCDDKEDAVVSRIEHIVRDKLNCAVPFDEQTTEHVRALIGAYSSILIENYSQSIHQIYRPTPFAFFVMTTKRLLEDVNILKKDRQKSESFETRKREREESGDDTAALHDGSVIKNLADNRRESTASTRLSYSSTSSSSSSQSPWTDLREDDVSLLDALESTMGLEGLASEVIEEGNTTFAREKNSPSDIQAYGTNQDDESLSKNRKIKIEKILLTHGDEITHTSQNLKSGNIPLSNESRTYHNEKEKSPLDTSFESELTPADTTNSRGSDSSSIQSRTTRSSSRSNT